PYRPGAFDAMSRLGQAMDDLARVESIQPPHAQTLSMGNDTLHGDSGNDLLVGDSEVLIVALGPETQPVDAHVLETAEHLRASVHALSQSTQGTVRPDVLLRGTDVLHGDQGSDIVVGDNAVLLLAAITPDATSGTPFWARGGLANIALS